MWESQSTHKHISERWEVNHRTLKKPTRTHREHTKHRAGCNLSSGSTRDSWSCEGSTLPLTTQKWFTIYQQKDNPNMNVIQFWSCLYGPVPVFCYLSDKSFSFICRPILSHVCVSSISHLVFVVAYGINKALICCVPSSAPGLWRLFTFTFACFISVQNKLTREFFMHLLDRIRYQAHLNKLTRSCLWEAAWCLSG